MSAFGIKAVAGHMLTKWRKAQEQRLTPSTSAAAPIVVRKWERPQPDWVKVNIDDELFESIDCIGFRKCGSRVKWTICYS